MAGSNDTFAITTSLLVPTRIAGPQTPAPEVTIDVIDPFSGLRRHFPRKWTHKVCRKHLTVMGMAGEVRSTPASEASDNSLPAGDP